MLAPGAVCGVTLWGSYRVKCALQISAEDCDRGLGDDIDEELTSITKMNPLQFGRARRQEAGRVTLRGSGIAAESGVCG